MFHSRAQFFGDSALTGHTKTSPPGRTRYLGAASDVEPQRDCGSTVGSRVGVSLDWLEFGVRASPGSQEREQALILTGRRKELQTDSSSNYRTCDRSQLDRRLILCDEQLQMINVVYVNRCAGFDHTSAYR
jgi:hypothetical protein